MAASSNALRNWSFNTFSSDLVTYLRQAIDGADYRPASRKLARALGYQLAREDVSVLGHWRALLAAEHDRIRSLDGTKHDYFDGFLTALREALAAYDSEKAMLLSREKCLQVASKILNFRVLTILGSSPSTPQELANALGIHREMLQEPLAELADSNLIQGWSWTGEQEAEILDLTLDGFHVLTNVRSAQANPSALDIAASAIRRKAGRLEEAASFGRLAIFRKLWLEDVSDTPSIDELDS